MGPRTHPDRRADRGADARRHGRQLALSARSRSLRSGALALFAGLAASSLIGAGQSPEAAYVWHLPRGFPTPAVPADNPMSDTKVALGKRLFFEPRLSVTGRYSCASCHDPRRAYSDGRTVAIGALGAVLPHNALALVNVAYNVSFGWTTPEIHSLEDQMLVPLMNEHPIELGLHGREAELLTALSADPDYPVAFAQAYPKEQPSITLPNVIRAIASFERTLNSGNSPFDRYVFGGDRQAMSDAAKRGMELFYSTRVGCGGCHSGFNFSGNWRDADGATGAPSFAMDGTGAEPIRVPTLRNVTLTAPYMHDGRFATLDAVLDHYEDVGQQSVLANESPHDPRLQRFVLSEPERRDLLAFLGSLTDLQFAAGVQ